MASIAYDPEVLALFGVFVTAVGGVAGAMLNSWAQRGKVNADATATLVDNLQEETRSLREELRVLREEVDVARGELSDARAEAYAIRDSARLIISMSAGYIYQLRAHIETEQGPPAPEIPVELREHFPAIKL